MADEQKHEVLDARSRHLLDQVAQPIRVEDLLNWSYDNLDANVASDYQREIYEYLLARGMVASELSAQVTRAILDDYRDWSGGFSPTECEPSELCSYIQNGRLSTYAEQSVTDEQLCRLFGIPLPPAGEG